MGFSVDDCLHTRIARRHTRELKRMRAEILLHLVGERIIVLNDEQTRLVCVLHAQKMSVPDTVRRSTYSTIRYK